MKISIHTFGPDHATALKRLNGFIRLLKKTADDAVVSIRCDEGSCAMAPDGRFPSEPPHYEVLGQTEDGRHVIVRFHRPDPSQIQPENLSHPADLTGWWLERDGTRHNELAGWTHLPVL